MNCHSHHIFLLPLRIEGDLNEDVVVNCRNVKWCRIPMSNDPLSESYRKLYNEQRYFYDHVHPILFDDHIEKNIIEFEYGKKSNEKYKFRAKSQVIELDIDKISLVFYPKYKIAIFGFHLTNVKYPDLATIKRINDFGRRIYPSYLDIKSGVAGPKDKFLPTSISTTYFPDDCVNFCEFNYKIKEKGSGLLPVSISRFLKGFKDIEAEQFIPLVDDRMFVVSQIFHDQLSKSISNDCNHLDSEDWHNLMYCGADANSNHANMKFRSELNRERTYTRWQEYGTLYGTTRFSFVVLTDTGEFARNVIFPHTQTMYFSMVRLCLAQRATIVEFSRRATDATKLLVGENTHEAVVELRKLQKDYLLFINQMYFREISHQEQGIDLYNRLQSAMRIPAQAKALEQEIQQLRDFKISTNQQEDNNLLKRLTVIASIFLIPTLVTSFLGMNFFGDDLANYACNWISRCLLVCTSILVILSFLYFIYYLIPKQKFLEEKHQQGFEYFFYAVIGIMLVVIIILFIAKLIIG